MTIRLGNNKWATVAKETMYGEDINDTFNATTPIGSVTAWLKDYTNTPTLPANWVECNGQTLSDAQSPYNGQVIPNLNGSLGAGLKGRFLRGHSQSGLTENSQNLAHEHSITTRQNNSSSHWHTNNSLIATSPEDGGTVTTRSSSTGSSGGTEARPSNYTVVWIMKIY